MPAAMPLFLCLAIDMPQLNDRPDRRPVMKIAVNMSATGRASAEEGEIYIDEDGDVNIVIAATHIAGLKEEDLVVCCLKGDAAWIRGEADPTHLAGMTRLTTGDSVTFTVE
jgi:hypothetical protein